MRGDGVLLGEASLEALERSVGRSVRCGDRRIVIDARPAVRTLLEALDEIENGGLLVARLPTGYGKSISTLFMAAGVASVGEELGLLHVIHVLPMRSILENVYRRALCLAGLVGLRADDVAFQASVHIETGVKDTLFQSRLIYTTLDSYALNYAKVTPLRTKYASYEAARASIYTSLTVFDEAHLFTEVDEDRAFTTLATIISSLLEAKLPVVLLTATLPTPMLEALLNHLPSGVPCLLVELDGSRQRVPSRCRKITVRDDAWREPRIETIFASVNKASTLPEDIVSEVVNVVEDGGRVAIVRNTVPLAIKTFEALRVSLPDDKLVLIHGRMTHGDRRKVEEKLEALKAGVVVATQVIEAGVDIDVELLISDAAPLAQLAQRAGRVCRSAARSEEGRECAGRFVVLHGGDEYYELIGRVYNQNLVRASLEKLRELQQRLPSGARIAWRDPRLENSYATLLDDLYASYKPSMVEEVHSALAMLDTVITLTRVEALSILEQFCSFVRDDARLPVLVYSEGLGSDVTLEKLYENVIELPLSYLNSVTPDGKPRYRIILSIKGEGNEERIQVVYVERGEKSARRLGVVEIPLEKLLYKGRLECSKVSRLDQMVAYALARREVGEDMGDDTVYSGLVGIVARNGVYEKGVGLVTDKR